MKNKKNAKMLMRRILCVALTLLMCVSAFAACSKKDEDDETQGAAEELLNLVENNEPKIKIVYQSATNTAVTQAIEILQNAVTDACGTNLSTASDALHTHSDDAVEILLGKTKSAASTEAMSALGENSFSVSVKGNKIVIVATNTYLYPLAAEKLVSALKIEDGKVSVAKDFSFTSESYAGLTVAMDKKSDYTIVYADDGSSAYEQALQLRMAFRDMGITLDISSDTDRKAKAPEILVGDTDRSLSSQSKAYYKGAWIGKDDSGNIAITGNVETGVKVFSEYIYNLGTDGGKISIVENMFGNFAPVGMGDAPLYNGGGEVTVNDSFELSDSYYILIDGASQGDFEDYIDTLKDAGFEQFYSTKANGNLFETWTDGYSILTLSHIAYKDPVTTDQWSGSPSIGSVSYMSIAVDCVDNSALPARQADVKKVTTEQLTTIGTECGYLLRLCDGRFVVFDGGMGDKAKVIYDLLVEQNVNGGKPVIAAWYLTHAHVDHIGALLSFVDQYSNQVKVESFVHNLPAYELYNGKNTAEIGPEEVCASVLSYSTSYYEKIQKSYPDADIIVAHAGQRFEFGGISIDVLWTTENLYKKQMLDTNMSSVLYSIKGESGRMIILGDQQEIGCALLNAIYEKELKCDIVQVAHHGYNGGDEDMYDSMSADYAIWSNSYSTVKNDKLHIQSINKRNKFDYTTVEFNLIPRNNDDPIILEADMSDGDLEDFDAALSD